MSYVDAGYAVALVVLAAYALSLIARRRRLTRAAAMSSQGTAPTVGAPPSPGDGTGRTAVPGDGQ